MNPQLENGYVRIASELLDALITHRIAGEQMQCLLFIMRKTYGFQKKEDQIALSQFVKATGIIKPHICRALKVLEDRNIIVTKKGNKIHTTYSINKRYTQWESLPKKVTLPKKVKLVTNIGNPSLPKKVPTINTTTKDTITKERICASLSEITEYFISVVENKFETIKIDKLKVKSEAENYFNIRNEAKWIKANKQKVKNWKLDINTWVLSKGPRKFEDFSRPTFSKEDNYDVGKM